MSLMSSGRRWRLTIESCGETSVRWDDPLPDGTVQPVDHPSWVMSKKL